MCRMNTMPPSSCSKFPSHEIQWPPSMLCYSTDIHPVYGGSISSKRFIFTDKNTRRHNWADRNVKSHRVRQVFFYVVTLHFNNIFGSEIHRFADCISIKCFAALPRVMLISNATSDALYALTSTDVRVDGPASSSSHIRLPFFNLSVYSWTLFGPKKLSLYWTEISMEFHQLSHPPITARCCSFVHSTSRASMLKFTAQ
jgi:hypothetical protein